MIQGIIFYHFQKINPNQLIPHFIDYPVLVDLALLVIVSIKFVWWRYVYMTPHIDLLRLDLA